MLSAVETGRKCPPVAQAKLQVVGIRAGVLFAAKGKIRVRNGAGHDLVPVDALAALAKPGRADPGGIRAANQSAHARPGDVVDRDVMLLEPGDDADMGEAECTAT